MNPFKPYFLCRTEYIWIYNRSQIGTILFFNLAALYIQDIKLNKYGYKVKSFFVKIRYEIKF